jgi:flagellar protein FlaJ
MAEEKKGLFKRSKKNKEETHHKTSFLEEYVTALRSLDDPSKYFRSVLTPLLGLGLLFFIMPFILDLILPIPLNINPVNFIISGFVCILIGLLYPYIIWKNKANDINGKMHYFITHLRVLAISDLPLRDIVNVISSKKAYGALGEELRKISVLSTEWRTPLAKSFQFVSKRTPSKILKDFLDRFSQSLMSGVEHREFIEHEQGAVLQEYETMYESSNENITILNEVYVSLLISIIFIMALGIVIPILMGGEDTNTFLYISSFLLIISEILLLYLIKSMIPSDEIWRVSGEKGEPEKKIENIFKKSVIACIVLGALLFLGKYLLKLPVISILPFEILFALTVTPLFIPGYKAFKEEDNIQRKERNFFAFLPALGSISSMRGGKITESLYYLSEKDYGILTKHLKDLYKRLRTRINDDAAWEWFGADTGSNIIQRASEMFREATYAAANPKNVSRMITENLRRIRNLRMKKLAIVKTSTSLFGGITFGLTFCIYICLVIAKHLNDIILAGMAGNPFEGTNIQQAAVLNPIPPETFQTTFIVVFIVLVIHSFLMGLTIRTLRGGHIITSLMFFVLFVWTVAITGSLISTFVGNYFTVPVLE